MPAIKVENLGKSYLVGHNAAQSERYTALRDVIARNAKSLARKTRDMLHGRAIIQGDEVEEFWALKDVSFEIKQGDRVGIIGRNGAGKSTLLKILSRITEPTTGRITINGRVASLLEVGTGFHPELTGRENIFLNGAILGMSRKEIQGKFDEIVDFAEVEKFLDTPVKRYSSGMYVRLAFAVAAHLEPEILVVDEVLAVGDAQFQKKCLGKMEDVSKQGRTVLFVSHNMPAIKALCENAILLDNGVCKNIGKAVEIIENYLTINTLLSSSTLIYRKDRKGNGEILLTGFEVRDALNREIETIQAGSRVNFIVKYKKNEIKITSNANLEIGVHGKLDENLFHLSTDITGKTLRLNSENGEIVCSIESLDLQPGVYSMNFFLTVNGDIVDWIQNAATFEVTPSDFFRTGRLPPLEQGPFLVRHQWFVSK